MGLLLCYFLGKWDPGALPPCLSSLELPENYALLRLSYGLCLGESLRRWVWGGDSL